MSQMYRKLGTKINNIEKYIFQKKDEAVNTMYMKKREWWENSL